MSEEQLLYWCCVYLFCASRQNNIVIKEIRILDCNTVIVIYNLFCCFNFVKSFFRNWCMPAFIAGWPNGEGG